MYYEKTTWANGDVITAEKLNKLEEGVQKVNSILPTASAFYENMFLGIKNGEYKLLNAPSKVFIVKVNLDNSPMSTDYPFAAAESAWQEGKIVIFVLHRGYNYDKVLLGQYIYGEDDDPNYFIISDLIVSNARDSSFDVIQECYTFKPSNGFQKFQSTSWQYTVTATKKSNPM